MTYDDPEDEYEVETREEPRDLFAFPVEVPIVITIKTEGRIYGAISQQFAKHYPTVELPHVAWGDSSGPVKLPDGKTAIFTAQWVDEEPDGQPYPPNRVYGCTVSCIRQAALAGFDTVAMPLLGGGEKAHRRRVVGRGIVDALELLDKRELDIDIVIALGGKGTPAAPTGKA